MTVKGNLSTPVNNENKSNATHTDFKLNKNRNLLEFMSDFFHKHMTMNTFDS